MGSICWTQWPVTLSPCLRKHLQSFSTKVKYQSLKIHFCKAENCIPIATCQFPQPETLSLGLIADHRMAKTIYAPTLTDKTTTAICLLPFLAQYCNTIKSQPATGQPA